MDRSRSPFRRRRNRPPSGFDDASATAAGVVPPPVPPKPPRSFEETAALIGVVKDLSNPRCARICTHWLKNDCLWGEQCRFSHDPKALRAGAPPTEEMNFSNLDFGQTMRTVTVPREQLKHFMKTTTRQLLLESSGISDLDWDAELSQAKLSGTASQVEKAEQLLRRAITHCNWGVSDTKVLGLLTSRPCHSAKLVLSPTVTTLRQAVCQFSINKLQVTMGSSTSNEIVLKGPLISRSHAQLELDLDKGALYILDLSTNGTFLNAVRLPKTGKVALFHGDDLSFPEPGKPHNLG
eukprot:symbB.v1.2.032061.t1/scaffold3798.1/size50166/1